jgi:hypothetical protein
VSIVIPRAVWEPRYANGFAVIGTGEWLAAGKEIWLHHSVTNPFGPDATLAQDCQHMRDFEAIGQNRFGGGISYTWVIMPSGRVFEGHSIDRQGSHTYQRNNRSRAICLAGNYDIRALPQRMQNSAALLLRELGATIDGPHSAVYATACPGRYAQAALPSINQLASSGAPIGADEDMDADQNNKLNAIYDGFYVGGESTPRGLPVMDILEEIESLAKTAATRPTSVTMTEADRDAIASKVKVGLLADLAPLFELAKRLES